jgi:hypothetical protein
MGKLDFRVTKKTSDAAFAHNSLLYYTTTQFNRSWGKLGSELLVNLTISLQNGVKWSTISPHFEGIRILKFYIIYVYECT